MLIKKINPVLKSKQDIKKIEADPLDDSEIREYLPDAKIMKYSQLARYGTINELLTKPTDYAILLYEDSENSGHWVCICRYDNTIEYFDPYGHKPDEPLNWTPATTKKKLRENFTYLSQLLNNAMKECKVIYNNVKYQELKENINTCGRHCCFRIMNMLKGCNLATYYKRMQYFKKTLGSYDAVVSQFIDVLN